METPDSEMAINEEYNGSKASKTRKENWILRDFRQGMVAGILSDEIICSDIGSDTSYLSSCVGTIINLGKGNTYLHLYFSLSLSRTASI